MSSIESLAYDPVGALARRVLAAGTRYYDGQNLTIRENNSGAAHVLVGGLRVATVSVSGVLYYHRDRLGSIVATSTAGGTAHGAIGAQYRYSTYGERAGAVGESSARHVWDMHYMSNDRGSHGEDVAYGFEYAVTLGAVSIADRSLIIPF